MKGVLLFESWGTGKTGSSGAKEFVPAYSWVGGCYRGKEVRPGRPLPSLANGRSDSRPREEEFVLANSGRAGVVGGCYRGKEVCPGHPLPSVRNGSK